MLKRYCDIIRFNRHCFVFFHWPHILSLQAHSWLLWITEMFYRLQLQMALNTVRPLWTGVAAASKTFIALATKPTIQLTELFQDLKVTRKSNGWMFLTEMFLDLWFFLHFIGFSMLISIIAKLSFTPIQPLKDCKSPKVMQKNKSLLSLFACISVT